MSSTNPEEYRPEPPSGKQHSESPREEDSEREVTPPEDPDAAPGIAYPNEDDWTYRPWSPSEYYTEPDTESVLLEAVRHGRRNLAASLGIGLTLLGILMAALLTIGWGVAFSGAGLIASVLGYVLARRSAQGLGLPLTGIGLATAAILFYTLVFY